jgi:putative addiction module component (TIGR02574 family)
MFCSASVPTVPITDFPVAERLRLPEEIWDSLDVATDELRLLDWHRTEIDTRLDASDSGASVGVPS